MYINWQTCKEARVFSKCQEKETFLNKVNNLFKYFMEKILWPFSKSILNFAGFFEKTLNEM